MATSKVSALPSAQNQNLGSVQSYQYYQQYPSYQQYPVYWYPQTDANAAKVQAAKAILATKTKLTDAQRLALVKEILA